MTRTAELHTFTTHDGVALHYRRWPARQTCARRGAIVLFHRGHEHGGRMAHLVDELDLPDFDFYAWDARGHGLSPGERGHSPSWSDSVRDVQTFVEHLNARWSVATQDIAVVAQSVGAVLVSTWVHDYAPPIRAQVLASPAFKVKLYVPLARPGLRLLQALRGNFFVNSYVKSRLLTHDPQRQASFDQDPLISRPISVNILLGLHEAAQRVVADAQAIQVPTQLLISGNDWVVHHAPQHRFFERLGSAVKECHVLNGFFHDTLGERDRVRAVQPARRFLLACFEQPVHLPNLRHADRQGPSAEEAQALAAPLPAWSPRAWFWAAYRAQLRLGAPLSEGLALGQRTGYDSGSTLDYVYRNTASGRGLLGRLIDRHYLNAIGWRGIRLRKQHLEALLRQALHTLEAAGQPRHLLDIAAGHGRYLLDALSPSPSQPAPARPDSLRLRDWSELNVAAGRALIKTRGLSDIARFDNGDAFDRNALAALAEGPDRPTLAVVSGLYELFPSNEAVSTSLAGVAAALPVGGWLVYTNQPWHPQLEMIARALTSHRNGQAWVMRRRSQAEMDQLVRDAGFEKVTQRIDPWGIFTVSLARRVA